MTTPGSDPADLRPATPRRGGHRHRVAPGLADGHLGHVPDPSCRIAIVHFRERAPRIPTTTVATIGSTVVGL